MLRLSRTAFAVLFADVAAAPWRARHHRTWSSPDLSACYRQDCATNNELAGGFGAEGVAAGENRGLYFRGNDAFS